MLDLNVHTYSQTLTEIVYAFGCSELAHEMVGLWLIFGNEDIFFINVCFTTQVCAVRSE